MASLEKIFQAISRYYDSLGKEYNGEFRQFCHDNGYDDMQSLTEELQEDPQDCMLVEFDDNFPFEHKPKDEEAKTRFIFDLLSRCVKDPDIPFSRGSISLCPTMDTEFFTATPKEIDICRKKLQIELPMLYDNGMKNDGCFIRWMAIGYKSGFPYLPYLCDVYSRAATHNFGNLEQRNPTVSHWASQNPHFHALKDMGKYHGRKVTIITIADQTAGALVAYLHRVMPRFNVPQTTKIDESLEDVCQYISDICGVVKDLPWGPWQLDACIVFGESMKQCKSRQKQDDCDDDDDDDDDMDDRKNNINDLTESLKSIDSTLTDYKVAYRVLDPKSKLIESLKDALHALSKDAHGTQKGRFVVLMDRSTIQHGKSQSIYVYESPSYTPLTSHSTSQIFMDNVRCPLIPPDISAVSKCNGNLLTCSFHIRASNDVRCYLCRSGQMIRFMPQDMNGILLPQLFVDDEKNREFVKSQEAQSLVEKTKIVDESFEAFCKAILHKN